MNGGIYTTEEKSNNANNDNNNDINNDINNNDNNSNTNPIKRFLKNPIVKNVLDWALHITLAVLIGFFIVTYVMQITVVSGSSMETTLHNRDMLIVEKVGARFGGLNRGDIVTINHPQNLPNENTPIIKRIVAIANDTVEIKNKKVYINGTILLQDYTLGKETDEMNSNYSKVKVKEGEIYVLGDNRKPYGSLDSRTFGAVSIKKVGGRAILRIAPLNTFGGLN